MEINISQVITGIATAVALGVLTVLWFQFTTYGRKAWIALGTWQMSSRWAVIFAIILVFAEGFTLYWTGRPIEIIEKTNVNITDTPDGGYSVAMCDNGTAVTGGCILSDNIKQKIYLISSGTVYVSAKGETGFQCVYTGGKLKTGDITAYAGCADKTRVLWR